MRPTSKSYKDDPIFEMEVKLELTLKEIEFLKLKIKPIQGELGTLEGFLENFLREEVLDLIAQWKEGEPI